MELIPLSSFRLREKWPEATRFFCLEKTCGNVCVYHWQFYYHYLTIYCISTFNIDKFKMCGFPEFLSHSDGLENSENWSVYLLKVAKVEKHLPKLLLHYNKDKGRPDNTSGILGRLQGTSVGSDLVEMWMWPLFYFLKTKIGYSGIALNPWTYLDH